MKKIVFILSLSTLLTSCGWIRSLRQEVSDQDQRPDYEEVADYDYYRDPMNRNTMPIASLSDQKSAALAGTPVDLSGTRAKSPRMTAKEFFADNYKNENSLWIEEGQSNYLFSRNKLKNPGDLVSIVIEDDLRKDMVNSVRKLLPPEYRDSDLRIPGLTKEATDSKTAQTAAPTPAAEGGAAETKKAELSSAEDMLIGEVLERYPNGNVRIRGIKRVPFKRQVRNIEVLAVVKGTDIGEDDLVKSSKFFDQRVELYR